MKSKFILLLIACCLTFPEIIYSQLNIGKKINDATKKTINKKVDQGVNNSVNSAGNAITDIFKKKKTNKNDSIKAADAEKNANKQSTSSSPALATYSKYDFIPGEKVIFYDDFTAENIGDFPAQWNTTGSGEVVTTNLFEGRWFNITNGRGATALNEPLILPDNYTIEFDVIPQKDPKNGNNTGFSFNILSTTKPKDLVYGLARPGEAAIRLSFEYNTSYHTYYRNNSPDLNGIDNQIRLLADKKYRISIWVQKERIRLYVGEVKVFDLPKAMSKSYKYNMIRFDRGTAMIGNVRVATGFPDMRSKLLTEGKLISYGIYFDVNKDVVKPESYGTLKGIADVLKENTNVRVKVVGHTDSDGADAANLDLSKRRGGSVKNELIKTFGIDASRLESDGLGESKPVAPNDTPANKALNRRVEFIKL
jgi:OmpA-OmpF porin, OOP family